MYAIKSEYYDLLYCEKDYEAEANKVSEIIQQIQSGVKSLLDIGCGTHQHAQYLSKHFSVDGLDVHEDFIRAAQLRNPKGHYYVADMRDFSIDKNYDVIVCLFSAITGCTTHEELNTTFELFTKHLNPGGIIIIEPWDINEALKTENPRVEHVSNSDIELTRRTSLEICDKLSIWQSDYTIVENGHTENYKEHFELGLFSRDDMESVFKKFGFYVHYEEIGLSGRGLFVGYQPE